MLDKKHYQVYKLIYERFIASQMAEALYDAMQIVIDNSGYSFKATGKSLKFAGFTAVYQEAKKEEEEEGSGKLLPPLTEGDALDALGIKPEQKFTKPR